MADKSIDLLQLLRGPQRSDGLRVVKVNTTESDPITFLFEGSDLVLDFELFEVPVNLYPLRKGDRLLAYPLVSEGTSQRWALIEKINGGMALGTMTGATSCQVEGVDREFGAADLIVPTYVICDDHPDTETSYEWTAEAYNSPVDRETWIFLRGEQLTLRPLKAGDLVSLHPTAIGDDIKYVVYKYKG